MTPIIGAAVAAAAAFATLAGYLLANTGILKKAEALAQKAKNAEYWLEKKLAPYVGTKTVAEVEAIVEDTIAAEVSRIVHLPAAAVITIARTIIDDLFNPGGKPAPAPKSAATT